VITVLGYYATHLRHREFDAVITIENADRNLHPLRVDDGRSQLVLALAPAAETGNL
jgi:hypothetical protein